MILRHSPLAFCMALLAGCGGDSGASPEPGDKVVWYQASTQFNAGGALSPTGQAIESGQRGEFTLTLEPGFLLSRVSGCGGSLQGARYLTAPMSADCTVTAHFEAERYQLQTEVQGAGQVSPDSLMLTYGQVGQFTVTAEAGHRLDSVSGCGGSLVGNQYTTSAVTEACLISARFSPIQHQARSQIEGNGALSPAAQWIDEGQQGVFDVKADAGHTLVAISGCGGELQGQQYLTGPMQGDCAVSARFISNAEHAVAEQDHRLASDAELIAYARDTLASSEAQRRALVDTLYQGIERISWHPSHDSISFESYLPETTWTLLPSNVNGSGEPAVRGLVMVSQQAEQRRAAMGANLFSVSRSAESDRLLKQLIGWLTEGADQQDGLSVVTAQVPSRADSWYFPHNEGIRDWLNDHYADAHRINDANACDDEALSACIEAHQPDLIILSDIDRAQRGHDAIATALAQARQAGIPLLLSNYRREASPMLTPLYREMGLSTFGNYWSKLHASNLGTDTIRAEDPRLGEVDRLLVALDGGDFDTEWLAGCGGNFLYCNEAPLVAGFKGGADWLRNAAMTLDGQGRSAFSLSDGRLIKTTLLLADKYRAAIDYPIEWHEQQAWQQAMFADWLVNYARPANPPQPDLGEFVLDRAQLQKGDNAHYAYPDTTTARQTITVSYRNQWTSTGWYALPGQTVTLTRHDDSDTRVTVKLNYHRPNTNRAFQQKVYRAPLELATQRLPLAPGQTLTFSSPYGGPVYLHLDGGEGALGVDVSAGGIARHPAILDFADPAQIAAFNDRINHTELPHVDLRSPAAEQHLRRDRFLNAIGGVIPDVTALLDSVIDDHINAVYTLAGYTVPGRTLAQSLPQDVATACAALLGDACLESGLHTRAIIQHANYDQNAHCGSGCSGNPWDAAWNISPTGWGDNHELGHNLQTTRLNVHYAAAGDEDNWSAYHNRAGENSNNLFPYYVKWRAHYLRDGNTTPISDGHMNHKSLFYGFMSDAAGVTNAAGERVVLGDNCRLMDSGASRYEAPWATGAYAAHNGYRMAFYIQMALRAHGMVLADGTRLENGFHLFTLLYQHSRIFGRYASDAASWQANRERLGFGLFPYEGEAVYGGRRIHQIPGNDFMLVALSHLTGRDWRSHFDLLGLRYSSLAAAQVAANAKSGALPMGMYVLETDLPPANLSEGLTFLPLSLTEGGTRWPRDNSTPADCPQP